MTPAYLAKIDACEGFHYEHEGVTYGMPYQPVPLDDSLEKWTPGIRECHHRYGIILDHLPAKTGYLLDIGSNMGYFAGRLSRSFERVQGIDANPKTIEWCREIWPSVPVLRSMFNEQQAFDCYDVGWDMILALAVIEYTGDQSRWLEALYLGLNVGGVCIIEGHSMDTLNGKFGKWDMLIKTQRWEVALLPERTDPGINAPKESEGRPVWVCRKV